jgi:hypothetical protein
LDARTVRRIVQNMANEDTEGAAQLLPQNTALFGAGFPNSGRGNLPGVGAATG